MKLPVLIAVGGLIQCGILLFSNKPVGQQVPHNQAITKANNSEHSGVARDAQESQRIPAQATPARGQKSPNQKDSDAEQFRQNIEIQRKLVIATIALVVVGILQAGILAWQAFALSETLKAMNRQVSVSETSANAAKASSESLTNSERAWVVINQINPPVIALQPNPSQALGMFFGVTFRNCGRTIARMINAQIRFHTVKAIEDLPPVPDYKPGAIPRDVFFGRIVAPNQDFECITGFEGGMPTSEQITAIGRGELVLVVYGCVIYLDFTNERRESQFCYVYKVRSGLVWKGINDEDRFETGGPQGYNRYT